LGDSDGFAGCSIGAGNPMDHMSINAENRTKDINST